MRAPSLALVLLLGLAGCPDEPAPPPSAGSSGTSTGDSSSSGALTPDLGASDQSTGAGWPLPTEDALLQCVRTCEGPWDCCPPRSEGMCPGPDYPYDYTCVDGLCVFPPCAEDAECPGADEVCTLVRGYPRCVLPCDGDEVCAGLAGDMTCSGTDDQGASYCFEHCTNPSVFCGNTSCDEATGECVCSSSGQCQSNWMCV